MSGLSVFGRYPAELFRDIEGRLSAPLFQGVPIGATLTDFFVINFLNAELSIRYAAAVRAFLGWWRFCLRGPRGHKDPLELERGRFLVTWSSDTPRFNDLVRPVIAALGPTRCNVIGRVASNGVELDRGIGSWYGRPCCVRQPGPSFLVDRICALSCCMAFQYQAVDSRSSPATTPVPAPGIRSRDTFGKSRLSPNSLAPFNLPQS